MSFYSVAPTSVQEAGQRIQALSSEIESLIGQLQSTARSVDWTGAGHSAFESAMVEWQAAANNIQEAATQIGIATKTAGVSYQDTDARVTNMFHGGR